MKSLDDHRPEPARGQLTLQTIAMPKDTNGNGDIFGGWLMSQMDLASSIMALRIAQGRASTVAVGKIVFHKPVHVGTVVSCYCELLKIGRTSITIRVEVWGQPRASTEWNMVTEGEFISVAIDDQGQPRPVPRQLASGQPHSN